jgi:signal transduction histidine kinase
MDLLGNLDLLSVGFTSISTAILGFVVFLNKRFSVTNRTFFLFSLLVALWGIFNYASHTFTEKDAILWLLRLVMFCAVWQSFFLFQFFFVFSKDKIKFSRWYKWLLIPLVTITSITTLTPLVFKDIITLSPNGGAEELNIGFGIVLFGLVSVSLVVLGVFNFVRKIIKSESKEKKKALRMILFGTAVSFILIIVFNFIAPVIWGNSSFVSLGSLFYFPFIAFTAYAIVRRGLLNVKIISTELSIFVLIIAVLFDVISSEDTISLIYKSSVLLLVFSVGILLIKSVRKEVEGREELTKLTHSLEKANLRLQEIDKQKTDFLSIASHQLRTPLSIAKGYIELIQDGAYGKINKKVSDILSEMDGSNEHLVKLVDEFLDITRIEQGRTKFNFDFFSINDLCEGVVKELNNRAQDKGLKVVWKPFKKLGKILLDEEKVRHVVFNFIDNAIKYSEKGSIVVSSEKEDKGFTIRVKDNGFGFGKEDQANFFQKFYRGKNVEGTNVTGTGLGLYVCRKFIEAHGGHVWAHSEGLGKGGEFGFWVPLGKKSTEKASKSVGKE